MDSIIKIFKWCIRDVNLWISLSEHTIESPQYTMGDSTCRFYLQFNYRGDENKLIILLCRCSDDDGPMQVETRFVLTLMTIGGYVMHTSDLRFSFERGSSEGITMDMTCINLLKILENEQESDAVLVTCTSILLEPTMVFLTQDVQNLSDDLWKLRNEARFNNAHFVARDERIPVCKEILCARSPVIERMFQKGDDLVEKLFQPEVVKTMIDYCYCSRVNLKGINYSFLEQLFMCANYYQISDLEKLLMPKVTNIISSLNSWTESHTLQFTTFTNLCKRSYSVEHNRIKMEFDENIEMSVKLLFRDYVRCGKIVLEMSLENLTGVKSVFVRLFTLDPYSAPKSVDEVRLEVTENALDFSLEYGNGKLFSTKGSILPTDILTLRFELKFCFPGEFHISDPDAWDSRDTMVNHQPSFALIRSMGSLLESKMHADAFLLLPPAETPSRVSVHKSILSVRSPVFEDMFKTSREVFVDLDESTVKDFLYYMYTGVLISSRLKIFDVLHKFAVEYRINTLKRACEEAVAKITLDTKNVLSVYLFAIRVDQPNLRNSCKDFILRNKDLIVCSNRWKKLRENNETAWNEIRQYISVS